MINCLKKVIFVFFVVKMLLLVPFVSQAFGVLELSLCTFYLNTAVTNGELVDGDGDGIYGFSAAGEALSDEVKTSHKNCCLLFAINEDSSASLECLDNCASESNADQVDTDLDGVGDACDNCPVDFSDSQADADGDGVGNVCDVDECSTTESPPLTEVEKCNGYASACETSVPFCEEVNDTYVWNCKHKTIEDCCALAGTNPPPPETIQACEAEKGENCFHVICSDVTQQWECTPIPGANCDECQPGGGVPAEKITECNNLTTPGQCEKYDPVCTQQDLNSPYKWNCEESEIENCCSQMDPNNPPAGVVEACKSEEGECFRIKCSSSTQLWECSSTPGCEKPTEDVCMIGTTKYSVNDAAPQAKAQEVCPPASNRCEVPKAKCTDSGWRCSGFDATGCEACKEGATATCDTMPSKPENMVGLAEVQAIAKKLVEAGKTEDEIASCFKCEKICNADGEWVGYFSYDEKDCPGTKEDLCEPIIHPAFLNNTELGMKDQDGDGVPNMCDNCINVPNPGQLDDDHDSVGNACDDDESCKTGCCGTSCCCSGPGCPASVAECPLAVGAEIGHPVMDPDGDTRRNDLKDKAGRPCDNCPTAANPYQDDWDLDTVGNACDNCTFVPNLTQKEAFDGACKDADFASNNVACGASCPAVKEVTPPTIADESKEEIPAENAEECKAAGGEWLFFDASGDLVTESDISAMIARGESVQAKCQAAAEFKGSCGCSFTEHSTWNMSAIYRLLLISLFFAVPYFWLRRRLATVKVKRK